MALSLPPLPPSLKFAGRTLSSLFLPHPLIYLICCNSLIDMQLSISLIYLFAVAVSGLTSTLAAPSPILTVLE